MKKLFGKKDKSEGNTEKTGEGGSGPPAPGAPPAALGSYPPPPATSGNYAPQNGGAYGGPPPAYSVNPEGNGSAPNGAPPGYAPQLGAPGYAPQGATPPQGYEPPPAYSESLSDGSSATVQYTGCVEQQMFQQKYVHKAAAAAGLTAPSPGGPVVHAQFDAAARFSKNAPASIPPPPPGVQPNQAQLAAITGGTVVMTQKKSSFLNGTGHGGSTFW